MPHTHLLQSIVCESKVAAAYVEVAEEDIATSSVKMPPLTLQNKCLQM